MAGWEVLAKERPEASPGRLAAYQAIRFHKFKEPITT